MSLYLGNNLISGIASPVEPTRNIGQIIQSTIPLTDAGLHLLDGTLIDGSGIYSAFVDYIAGLDLTASYFCTEQEWQASVTQYGVCGKFVYDSVNNTVRLPKYNSKIYTGGGTAPVVGNGMTLGLTDGTNNYGLISRYDGTVGSRTAVNSKYYDVSVGTAASATGTPSITISLGVTTDPTKSGIIAQLSDITTSLDGYYYIVVATSTKTDIQVDIDEIATDLNGKADVDLSNCTKPHIVETYINGTSWYRVWSDGWCEQGGYYSNVAQATITIYLLKSYSSSNYDLQISCQRTTSNATAAVYELGYLEKFVDSFTKRVSTPTYESGFSWQACGYIN